MWRACCPWLPRRFPMNPGFSGSAFTDARIAPRLRLAQGRSGGRHRQHAVGADGYGGHCVVDRVRQRGESAAGARRWTPAGTGDSRGAGSRMGTNRARTAARKRGCWVWPGARLGLALAYGALRVLVASELAHLPRIHEISIDPTVLAFTVGDFAGRGSALRPDSGLQVCAAASLGKDCAAAAGRSPGARSGIARAAFWWWCRWRWRWCCWSAPA